MAISKDSKLITLENLREFKAKISDYIDSQKVKVDNVTIVQDENGVISTTKTMKKPEVDAETETLVFSSLV